MTLKEVLLVLIFFATVITIIKEPMLKFKKWKLRLDYGVAPILAILLLFIIGFLNFQNILDALNGINNIVPWQIIIIFFTLAYIFISLDTTGLFEYISFKILKLVKHDGRKLFFSLIILSAVFTTFTSNDIVTLTMTPIILYLSKHSKLNPIPYLMAVFFTSNTWSMMFYIGSPTNIIVAQALNLGFLEYTKFMFIPTIFAGITITILSFLVMKKEIPRKIKGVHMFKPEHYLRNKHAAIIGSILVLVLFGFLLLSDFLNLVIWKITTIFAGIYLLINILLSIHQWKTKYKSHPYHHKKTKMMMHAHNLRFDTHELLMSVHRMPWKILPLITSFFVLVHMLSITGLGTSLTSLLNQFTGLFSGTIFTGLFSAMSANLMIDQPMSIFFSNAILSPNYLISGVNQVSNGLALIIGANLGDNLTLFGALAGLMWIKMLRYSNIKMSYMKFVSYSVKIIPLTILLTCIVLALQMKLLFS